MLFQYSVWVARNVRGLQLYGPMHISLMYKMDTMCQMELIDPLRTKLFQEGVTSISGGKIFRVQVGQVDR